MSDVKQQLVTCFATVFPDVSVDDIPQMAVSSQSDWDSLKTMTLVAVIEEEFEIEVSGDGTAVFMSFPLILNYVETQTDAS
jgi:acyl carrier protein